MDKITIPRFVIDDFLLGRVRPDVLERFTQSGDVVAEVWGAFAKDLQAPVRVLIAPVDGVSAVEVGAVLHCCIDEYRGCDDAKAVAIDEKWRRPGDVPPPEKSKVDGRRQPSNISPLESFVAITLYWDELFRVVLPLTRWWSEKNIGALNRKRPAGSAKLARDLLEAAIADSLIHEKVQTAPPPKNAALEKADKKTKRIVEAAPYASLVGLFVVVAGDTEISAAFCKWDKTAPGIDAKKEELRDWLGRSKATAEGKAEDIAHAAIQELQRKLPDSVLHPQGQLGEASKRAARMTDPDNVDPPALIRRVFLDRKATLAAEEGVCTIKADAANRLFNVSCRDITWAIMDAGIAAKHPAFEDHLAAAERGVPSKEISRVTAILDFTLIEKIRSFDLIADGYGQPERAKAIDAVIALLNTLPDEPEIEKFEEVARKNLQLVAAQMKDRLQPDWNLIEPLIRRKPGKGDPELASGHGTHVAGILGADWREDGEGSEKKKILEGVCPDINLYDLRVINHQSRESTEFAILAALEYVQFANRRTSGLQQVIQGVNISLSIPHEVRNYACGSTPICVACDNLVGSGVVVVAAAGNRGWNEQEMGFGSFVFCSITDPGNAQEVITVGATHRQKPHTYGVSFFSSRGPTGDGRSKPDLVAPGEKIKGPVLGDADDELDGTSMAAPFVSGAAAMLIARHGELYGRPRRIKEILCASATDLGREKYFQGHGLLDVLRAIQSV